MLVIISDLHLTDGTSGHTIRDEAFKVFRQRLSDLAYDASWRDNDTYRPIESLDVVLLGDILDIIRSTRWHNRPMVFEGLAETDLPRPWTRATDSRFIDMVAAIHATILDRHKGSLGILKGLSAKRGITIPKADEENKPLDKAFDPAGDRRQSVAVRLHYMIGNHDWFYGLPGAPFDTMREQVIKAMGLAHDNNQPFPHDPEESARVVNEGAPSLLDRMLEHNVFARHGDIFDPANFEGDRLRSSLGDAIVVDMICRFTVEIEKRGFHRELPKETLDGLKELDNVRPLERIPAWIKGLLDRTCRDESLGGKVKNVWEEIVHDFVNKNEFVKRHGAWNKFDFVDKLKIGLFAARFTNLETIARFGLSISLPREEYEKHAMQEPAFKNRTARFIVYGHTHHHEVIPLDMSYSDEGQVSQYYLNSGTWRRVHELSQLDTKRLKFEDHNVLTYLAFFKGDERGGRRFESWTGSMGIGADDNQ